MTLNEIVNVQFECCRKAAKQIMEAIKSFTPSEEKPYFVLGLATGSPLLVYDLLVSAENKGLISFENVVTFNLDEYIGLPRDKENPHKNHELLLPPFPENIQTVSFLV